MLSDYCKQWIRYAQNDVRLAAQEMERAVNPRHRAYEAILYHCQQAAEKMLKAYLIHNGVQPWGHDLDALRTKCVDFDSGFNNSRITKHCIFLLSLAAARYPDFTAVLVYASSAERALNSAKRIYDFVSVKLGQGEVYFKKQ